MTKKYSEEEYNKIIKAFQSKFNYDKAINEVIEVVSDMRGLMPAEEIQQAISLALPVSRKWAHDNFVEKEEKYYWKLNGLFLVKASDDGSLFFGCFDASTLLSESELKAWGFNPDIFERLEAAAWD